MSITILHILSGDLWAGAEVQAFNLLNALHRRGDVRIASVVMNPGELSTRLQQIPTYVRVLDERRLTSADILRQLRLVLCDIKPDIVHTHRIKENILGSIANSLSARSVCVRTVHGATESVAPTVFRRALMAADSWCGTHLQEKIIAVSPALATQLRLRYSSAHLVTIENGIDVDAVRLSAQAPTATPFETESTHIGIVGRLTPVKNPSLFLQAAAALRRSDSTRKWRFHLVGDGPLRQTLAQEVRALDLEDVTLFHGHRIDVAAYIARLDALVMCSDHEGLPMTLLEAMAIGTPIVGHSVGGIAQLLHNSSHGWPVVDHTAAGYARAIRDALINPDATAARSRAAAAHVQTHYSASQCASNHLALYSRLLAARVAAAQDSLWRSRKPD